MAGITMAEIRRQRQTRAREFEGDDFQVRRKSTRRRTRIREKCQPRERRIAPRATATDRAPPAVPLDA